MDLLNTKKSAADMLDFKYLDINKPENALKFSSQKEQIFNNLHRQFKEAISMLRETKNDFENRVDTVSEFTKEDIEIRIESLKEELDQIKELMIQEVDQNKQEIKKNLNDEKLLKAEDELKNLEEYLKKKGNHEPEQFAKYQNSLESVVDETQNYYNTSFQIELQSSLFKIKSHHIGTINKHSSFKLDLKMEKYRCLYTFDHEYYASALKYIGEGLLVSGDSEESYGGLRIWNINDGSLVKKEQDCRISFILPIPSQRKFITLAGFCLEVAIWDLDTLNCRRLEPVEEIMEVNGAVLLDNGQLVISGCLEFDHVDDSCSITCFEIRDDKLFELKRVTISEHEKIKFLLKLPNNELASYSEDGHIKIWSANELKVLRSFTIKSSPVVDLVLYQSNFLISASMDKKLQIWDYKNGFCLRTIQIDFCIHRLKLVSNKYLVGRSFGESHKDSLKFIDLDSFKCVFDLPANMINNEGEIFSIEILSNDRFAVSCENFVKCFDFQKVN